MGQGLANQLPLCCAQEACQEPSIPVVKATPSLQCVTAQSRNLQHQSWEVRAEAADFFGTLGSESVVLVVPMLVELLLKDDSWRVRQHAADALQDLGAEAVAMAAPALRKVTQEDEHYTVRLAAAVTLRKHGHKAEAAKPVSQFDDFGTQIGQHMNASNASTSTTSTSPTPMMSTTTTPTSYSLELGTPQNASEEDLSDDDTDAHASPFVDTEPASSSPVNPPQKELLIVVERAPSGKWGIDVDFVVSGTCLRVSKVKDGALLRWNQENPDSAVEVGDLLIEMNGVSGDSKELVKEICKADRLEILVQKGSS
jgi:hypothetical protein